MADLSAELSGCALTRYAVTEGLAVRHWKGESTAVARSGVAGSTHLIDATALAVIEAAGSHPHGLPARRIAHALGVGDDPDPEVETALERIIDDLIQSGLLRRVDDDADPGPAGP